MLEAHRQMWGGQDRSWGDALCPLFTVGQAWGGPMFLILTIQ